MAKGRSHSRSRDDNSIANRYDVFDPPLRPTWLSRPILDPVQDLRVYHPYTQLLGPLEVSRGWVPGRPGTVVRSAQVREVKPGLGHAVKTDRFGNVARIAHSQRAIFVFKEPRRVPVCVRRKQRREVLFSKGKAGRGYRKPRWNERSYMRCR